MSGLAVRMARGAGEAEQERAHAMLSCIEHLGGDRVVALVAGQIEVAHAAFFTTPESALEEFPVAHPTRDMWVVADARLDYRAELLASLRKDKCSFEPVTDAEFILAAHEVWGLDAQQHLTGDFAYVLWDGAQIVAARDVVGMRPLWWSQDSKGVIIASTLRCVLEQLQQPPEPNEAFVADLLSTRLRRHDYTAYRGIQRLEPGARLCLKPGGEPLIESVDELRLGPLLDVSAEEAARAVRDALASAVEQRMRPLTPVACELSGGLDSSTIVGLAASHRPDEQLVAISNVFPGQACDESVYISSVVEMFQLHSLRAEPLQQDPIDLRMASATTKDVFAFPDKNRGLWALAAAQGARTVLTGQGGDEAFGEPDGSYLDWIFAVPGLEIGRRLIAAPAGARMHAIRHFARVAVEHLATVPRSGAAIRQLVRMRQVRKLPWISRRLANQVSASAPVGAWPGLSPGWNRKARLGLYQSPNKVRAFEHLHQSSAGLVNVLHPFYDRRFIELVLQLPANALYPNGENRALHRRAFVDVVPPAVLVRSDKAEFSAVYRASFAHNAPEGFGALSANDLGWTNAEVVDEWGRYFTSGECAKHAFPLWQCLAVSCWADVV